MYTFQFYSHPTNYLLFLLGPPPYSFFFKSITESLHSPPNFMFLFILYKTHRVQSTLTIYTIYQGCYSSRKLTPPPSQQSTTASSFSVEEEAHQPLIYPFWNVYWLRLVQKNSRCCELMSSPVSSIQKTHFIPSPSPNPQVLRCEVGLVARRMEVNVSSCSAFIRKANEYHF